MDRSRCSTLMTCCCNLTASNAVSSCRARTFIVDTVRAPARVVGESEIRRSAPFASTNVVSAECDSRLPPIRAINGSARIAADVRARHDRLARFMIVGLNRKRFTGREQSPRDCRIAISSAFAGRIRLHRKHVSRAERLGCWTLLINRNRRDSAPGVRRRIASGQRWSGFFARPVIRSSIACTISPANSG